jgi:pantetheine-phosphate adenylyltransferase
MRIAVYAGTFDPITHGHLSVIERAAPLFEELIVLIAVNPDKQPLFDVNERLEMIREATAHLPSITVDATPRYVVVYAREHGAGYLIRGVRGATDTEYEITLAAANRELAPEVTTMFLPADPGLSEVSSSRLKALALAGADISTLCPAGVQRRLRARFPVPLQLEAP